MPVVNEIDSTLPPGLSPTADAALLVDAASRDYVAPREAGCAYATASVRGPGVPAPPAPRLSAAERADPHGCVCCF